VVLVQVTCGNGSCYGPRRGHLHGFVDRGCLSVESSPEDAGKGQDVVDLIRVIRAASRHDSRMAMGFLRGHLGGGVCQGKDDGVSGHLLDGTGGKGSGAGKADKDIGAHGCLLDGALEPVRVRVPRNPLLPGIHVFRSSLVNDPRSITTDDVAHAGPAEYANGGDPGRPYAV